MEPIIQTCILICSAMVAFLVSSKKAHVRKIGFIFGLCGQPFWFWTSINHGQWAITILAVWYTICHARGIRNSKEPPEPEPKALWVPICDLEKPSDKRYPYPPKDEDSYKNIS